MKKYKIAVLCSGLSRGSNFVSLVESFFAKDFPVEVAFVVVTRKNAPIRDKCTHMGIDDLVLRIKDPDFYDKILAHLESENIDLVALAGFIKKIPASFIKACPCPILNIHPALLPLHGGVGMYGMHVHNAVLASGERLSGATVHYANESYDEGDIVLQETINISMCKTAQEISQKVLAVEHRIYAPAIWKVLTKA